MRYEITYDGSLLPGYEDGFTDQGDALDAIEKYLSQNPVTDTTKIKLWQEIPIRIKKTVKVETDYR